MSNNPHMPSLLGKIINPISKQSHLGKMEPEKACSKCMQLDLYQTLSSFTVLAQKS